MASLYMRPKSPFWWIKWKDSSGIHRESTRFRHGIRSESIKARILQNERTTLELKAASPSRYSHRWAEWVPAFISARFHGRTRKRVNHHWHALNAFLQERGISGPEELAREACFAYFAWRTAQPDGRAKTSTHANTAIGELGTLRTICGEAVRNKWIPANPAASLKIPKVPPRVKGEITPELEKIIRDKIATLIATSAEHAVFLDRSFTIAMLQGWRLAETCIPLSAFDSTTNTVRRIQKGNRTEITPVCDALMSLVNQWREAGDTHTIMAPPENPSLTWWKFFDDLRREFKGKFDNISFHSTRVTVISRMESAGVPEPVCMALLGHKSVSVHRIYRRFSHAEVRAAWAALASVAPSGGTPLAR